jgi:asparagine synthase (glutamine-hydrolysing)
MCGINGVHHYRDDAAADAAAVERAASIQRHRGPDDAGVWADGPVALGHRRLAIVDLSPGGHQPLANEDGTLWVTFNGEIYNWPALRGGLAARGHRFRGTSDTEALLHLYEEHGDGMLAHLRGMFAFALWDGRRRRMLVARDRVGKKPLYWHDDGRRLAFASELKALLALPGVPRDVDPVAALDYLAFQYVPSPRSIWRGIHKLPPGHFLVSDAGGARVERYWSLPVGPVEERSDADAVAQLRARLEEAVRIRLMSDVPLGAFLSGGVDSSAVVALMSRVSDGPVRTFSIGFDEQEFSELEHARAVAKHLGTEHHEFVVRPRALELLPRLVWHLDEPFADASMIPAWSVAETARRHVTVALSGDGGDEAFGGYVTYPWALRYARMDRLPRALRRLAAAPAAVLGEDSGLGRKLRRVALTPAERHLDAMSFFPRHALAHVAGRAWRDALADHDPWAAPLALHARAARGLGDIPALLALDAMTYMSDDVLVKVDRTSMAHSLEVRCPLLDHEVLEFAARLPFRHKLRGGVSKWILRECVRDLLPAGILERGKQGFGVPLTRWFGDDFGRLARDVLLDPRARARGWLDPRGVERLLEGGGVALEARTYRVWALTCLELWAQSWVDRAPAELAAPLETVR